MSEEAIKTQMAMLVNVVRCIQLKASLTDVDPEPPLNFWRLSYGGLMDLAVLEWCKIFGSNVEPTHWKSVVTDKDNFRNSMLSYLGIDEREWNVYWQHMKNYRDEFVTHFFTNSQVRNYPDLELALKSSYFYYDYLAKLLGDETMPKLESYGAKFYKQSKEIATIALESTKEFKEKVY